MCPCPRMEGPSPANPFGRGCASRLPHEEVRGGLERHWFKVTERVRAHPHSYFPVFLDLEGRRVTVIGGGEVALRKVEKLLASGAVVTVIAPQLDRRLRDLAAVGQVVLEPREYRSGDLEGSFLVVAATSDEDINRAVAAEASRLNLLANVVDAPELCNFIVPSTIQREGLTLAISTGGMSPALAKQLRRKLEELLVPEYGPFLQLLASLRQRIRRELPLSDQREAFWSEVVESNAFDLFRSSGEEAARVRIEEILKLAQNDRG